MDWADLFERASVHGTTVGEIADALARRRAADDEGQSTDEGANADTSSSDGGVNADAASPDEGATATSSPTAADRPDPSPARIVADADVLAADLLVGGPAREAVDLTYRHDWVTLVASDALLADAAAVVADLADADLATDWRALLERERESVAHPTGDHPALASALHGGAMHVLTFDDALRSAQAGAAIRGHVETSVKDPAGFVRLFDPERLYPVVTDGEYPGPDRESRG